MCHTEAVCVLTPSLLHSLSYSLPIFLFCLSFRHAMAKRRNAPSTAEGYPGLRSKRPKLAPLLPHERDYLSLPTTDPLSLPAPPINQQHHHRYDLRVRPPRPPNPPVNGHGRGTRENAVKESGRWRNAHSFSLSYQQQRLSNSSANFSSHTRHRQQPSPSPTKRRRRHAPPNENSLVCESAPGPLFLATVIALGSF